MERLQKPDVKDPIYGWVGCLATGLAYLHEQKSKHRDVKPANILLRTQILLMLISVSQKTLSIRLLRQQVGLWA